MSSDSNNCNQERTFYASEVTHDLIEIPQILHPYYCNDNVYYRYDSDLCPCMSFCCLDTGNQPKALVLYATCIGTPNRVGEPIPEKNVKVALYNNGRNIFTGSTRIDNNTYFFEVICDKGDFGGTGGYGIYTLRIISTIEGQNITSIATLLDNSYQTYATKSYSYVLFPAEDGNLVYSGCRGILVAMGGYLLEDGFNAKIRLEEVPENVGNVICPPCECARKIELCPNSRCPELGGVWPCPPPQCPYTYDQLHTILHKYLVDNKYYAAFFPSRTIDSYHYNFPVYPPEPYVDNFLYRQSCFNHIIHIIHPSHEFNPPPPPFTVLNISGGSINEWYSYTVISAPYFSAGCIGSTTPSIKLLPDIKFLGKVTAYIEFDRLVCEPGTITPEEYLLLREQYLNESGCIMSGNNDQYCLELGVRDNLISTCTNYWFAVKEPKNLSPCFFPDNFPCPPPLNQLNSDGPCSIGPIQHPQSLIIQASVCKDYYKALPFFGYYDLYFTNVQDQDMYFELLSAGDSLSYLRYPIARADQPFSKIPRHYCFWVSRFVYTIYFINKICLNGPTYIPYNVMFAMRERKTSGSPKYDFWIIFLTTYFRYDYYGNFWYIDRAFVPFYSLYFPLDENLQYVRSGPPSVDNNIFTPSRIIVSRPCQ